MSKNPLQNFMHHMMHIAARAEFAKHSDQQLLQRYIDHRDELAFAEVVRRRGDLVWHVCKRVLQNNHDAEDAYQATFTALVRKAKAMLWRESIDGWLHDVAYRIATKAKVEWARRRAREDRRAHMREENFNSDVSRGELSEVLDKELTCIPEKYRVPLILCYLEGLTCSQAAQRLGISVRTLEWRLEQGREKLRKRLLKYGMDMGQAMLMAGLSTDTSFNQVPPELVEKTLDIVRILTLSKGAFETAGISPQVAILAKWGLGLWTLKTKVLVGFLLLSLAVAGGVGVVTRPAFFLQLIRGGQQKDHKPDLRSKAVEEVKEKELPPRTDLYDDPLPKGALARLGTVRFRYGGPTMTRWFGIISNKKIVAIAKDNDLCLLHLDTGKPSDQLKDPSGEPFHIEAMSSDGRFLAGRSGKKEDCFLWDTTTEKLLRLNSKELRGVGPLFMALSRDGKTVAFERQRKIYMVDYATGDVLWENDGGFEHMVYSLDGKTLLHALRGGAELKKGDEALGVTVRRWDVATGKELSRWIIGDKQISSFTLSPDGSMLATVPKTSGEELGFIQLWNMTTGKQLRRLSEKSDVDTVIFSSDGKILATGNCSGKICLWDTNTGQMRSLLGGGSGKGTCGDSLAFSSDGKLLVSLSWCNEKDCVVRVWDVALAKESNKIQLERGHQGAVKSIYFLPDGKSILSNGSNGSLRLWDTSSGAGQYRYRQLEADIHGYSHGNYVSAVSPDGTIVASTGYSIANPFLFFVMGGPRSGGSIHFWDTSTGKELRSIQVPISFPTSMAFSPDSKLLACSEILGATRLWDVATGKLLDTLPGCCLAFSHSGKFLAASSRNGSLCLWDTTTYKILCKFEGYGSDVELTSGLAISQDGQRLAMALKDKSSGKSLISLWNIQSGKKWSLVESLRITAYESDERRAAFIYPDGALAFSPDGKSLASVSKGNIVRLWETATGKERNHFSGHHGKVWSLAFASDGRRLASGSSDTTVLIWDVTGQLDDHGMMRPALLSTKQMQSLWVDLAADAANASPSMWRLVAAGDATVSFLKKHLRPAVAQKAPEEAIAKLITDLDSETYAVRRKARQELEALGEVAEPSLRQALGKNPSVELRHSLEHLLTLVAKKRTGLSGIMLRDLRAIEVLEQIGSREARQMLEVVSAGTSGDRKTQEAQAALRRLQAVQKRP